MIAIIDYGVGNLFSLRSSFAAIGQEAVVTSDIEEIRRAERLILPGVGRRRFSGRGGETAGLRYGPGGEGRNRQRETADGRVPGHADAV